MKSTAKSVTKRNENFRGKASPPLLVFGRERVGSHVWDDSTGAVRTKRLEKRISLRLSDGSRILPSDLS